MTSTLIEADDLSTEKKSATTLDSLQKCFEFGRQVRDKATKSIATSQAPLGSIESIHFGLLNPEVFRRLACLEVNKYTLQQKGYPQSNSVNDSAFGVSTVTSICERCRSTTCLCDGIFGIIELSAPIFHVLLLSHTIKVLRSVCFQCSRLLNEKVGDNEAGGSSDGRKRLEVHAKLGVRATRCPHDDCQAVQYDYVKTAGLLITIQHKNGKRNAVSQQDEPLPPFSAKAAREILENISDDHAIELGFQPPQSRPEFMILVVLPVPPLALRPATSFGSAGGKSRGDDALTRKLQEIVRCNEELRAASSKLLHRSNPQEKVMVQEDVLMKTEPDMQASMKPQKTKSTLTSLVQSKLAKKRAAKQEIESQVTLRFEGDEIIRVTGKQAEIDPTIDVIRSLAFDPSHHVETRELCYDLQYQIATYFRHDLNKVPQPKRARGRAQTNFNSSHCSRLKGKQGIPRSAMLAHRDDYSARAVIIPSPSIDIDQVGVPIDIAKGLTMNEVVTPLNIAYLSTMVKNGPDNYPGANHVVMQGGSQVIDLRFVDRYKMALQIGWTVKRHLLNDDLAILNRQPSLHKMSIMAHRVKVVSGMALQLSMSVCAAYNADFDGDAMVMHVLQTTAARVEARSIMSVSSQIITPQSNTPIIGLIQDVLLGSYRLTLPNVWIDASDYMRYLAQAEYRNQEGRDFTTLPPALQYRNKQGRWIKKWSGKQLLSELLPSKLHFVSTTSLRGDDLESELKKFQDDRQFCILGGQLISGQITSKTVQKIIHMMVHEYGNEYTCRWMSDMRIINAFLSDQGFSVGVSDCVMQTMKPEQLQHEMQLTLASVKEATDQMDPRKSSTEGIVCRLLNEVGSHFGQLAISSVDASTNRMCQMMDSGSKGKKTNLVQMMACLGQQIVGGTRLGMNGQRLTSHAPSRSSTHKVSFADQGFVSSNFARGLTPNETYAHAYGGREGLISSSLSVADMGYIQRKLVKGLESILVRYDLSCRDSANNVVQYLYGHDGFDSAWVISLPIESFFLSPQHFSQKFGSIDYIDQLADVELIDSLYRDSRYMKELTQAELNYMLYVRHNLLTDLCQAENSSPSSTLAFPFDLKRILNTVCLSEEHQSSQGIQVISASLLVRLIRAFIERLYSYYPGKLLRQWGLELHILTQLCMRNVVVKRKCTMHQISQILVMAEDRFRRAIIRSGDSVGVTTAQCIGQLATQSALDLFHNSGGAAGFGNRAGSLQDCININDSPARPSLDVYLKSMDEMRPFLPAQIQSFQQAAQFVARKLIHRSLAYFVNSIHVVSSQPQANAFDFEWIQQMYDQWSNADHDSVAKRAPLCIRLEVDVLKCFSVDMQPEFLIQCMQSYFKESVNDDNADSTNQKNALHSVGSHTNALFVCSPAMKNASKHSTYVIRIHISPQSPYYKQFNKNKDIQDENQLMHSLAHHMCKQTDVLGIENIQDARVVTEPLTRYNPASQCVETETNYMIVTKGTNLSEVMCLPWVDQRRTCSNHILEVQRVLGIRAASNCLFQRLQNVMRANGSTINESLFHLLVSSLTHRGYIGSMKRSSFRKVQDSSIIQKMSFEECVSVLADAGVAGAQDPLVGAAERTMTGLLAKFGTEFSSVQLQPGQVPDSDHITQTLLNRVRDNVMKNISQEAIDVMVSHSRKNRVFQIDEMLADHMNEIQDCVRQRTSQLQFIDQIDQQDHEIKKADNDADSATKLQSMQLLRLINHKMMMAKETRKMFNSLQNNQKRRLEKQTGVAASTRSTTTTRKKKSIQSTITLEPVEKMNAEITCDKVWQVIPCASEHDDPASTKIRLKRVKIDRPRSSCLNYKHQKIIFDSSEGFSFTIQSKPKHRIASSLLFKRQIPIPNFG